jgi:hypothetical protein
MTEEVAARTTAGPLRPDTPRWAKEVRKCIDLAARGAWYIGDVALDIAPMGDRGIDSGAMGVLAQFADEIGLAPETVRGMRTVAHAWPEETRLRGTSWSVHRILQGRRDLIQPGMTARQAAVELAAVRIAEAPAEAVLAVLAGTEPPEPPPALPEPPPTEGTTVMLTMPRCSLCTGTAVIAAVVFGSPACLCRACATRTEHASPLLLRAAGAAGPPPSPGEVAAFLAAQTWTSARSMPDWPHEWVMARRSTDVWMALRVIEFIRETGNRRRWHADWFWYWTPEGSEYEYWSMNPGETVINRRRLDWDDNSG